MERTRILIGLILALALTSCQGAQTNSPTATNESPDSLSVEYQSETIRQGSFENAERPTSGTVELAKSGESHLIVLGGDFKTSKGPDLQVVLHRSDNLLPELSPPTFPLNEADYVVLGGLKALKGEQTYPIPAKVNLEDYGSVAIWCEKFNATFGAANLAATSE